MNTKLLIFCFVFLLFACKSEQKKQLTAKTVAQETVQPTDSFRLKDSVLIDKIERAFIKEFEDWECPDSSRRRNSDVYSLMPNKNDFSCFVVQDYFCHGYSGSSGHEGVIGQYKNGKIKILYDAFGKCANVSDDLTHNRRRVWICRSGGGYELYFNGKRWGTMDYWGNVPYPLYKVLTSKIKNNDGLLSDMDRWQYGYRELFKVKNKKIYSLEKYYQDKGIQLIECDDYFSNCRELTIPTLADSVYVLNPKQDGYPQIGIIYKRSYDDSLQQTVLTYKKGRYYSYDARIYLRPEYLYPDSYEYDTSLQDTSTGDYFYKNGVPLITYKRKLKGNRVEKGVFYWNGTDYKTTTNIKQFYQDRK